MTTPIQLYLERCLEPRFQNRPKDKLFQRRWAMEQMTPITYVKGGPTVAQRIPNDCYMLSEHRFCQMLVDDDFIADMRNTTNLSEVLQVVALKVGDELKKDAEAYGMSLYFSAPSLLKVKGGRDSQIGVEFANLLTHPSYDAEQHGQLNNDLFLSMMEATCELREELKRRDAEKIEFENLLLLWHHLRTWHGKLPSREDMHKADGEMGILFEGDWKERVQTLGDLEGANWTYWNSANYLTPFLAEEVGQAYKLRDNGEFRNAVDKISLGAMTVAASRH